MKLIQMARIAVAALGVALAGAAAAHSDEYLETVQAPNGGQLRMAGGYHYELVVKPGASGGTNEVLVYLTDHAGTAVPTEGASGTVTVLSKGKTSVALKPEGKNAMRGSGNFEINPKLKAVVSVALPGQQAEQARFSPFAKAADGNGSKH